MEIKTYQVNQINDGTLTGPDIHSSLWNNAFRLSDFTLPWDDGPAPAMIFRALYDREWLYCLFNVQDSDVKVYVNKNEKAEVIYSDRVEMFFRQNEQLNLYYCLEIDPLARVYDYRAAFHRKFDPSWAWPSGHLVVQTERNQNNYAVSCAISMESLKHLGLLNDMQLQTGLFRGKCLELDLAKENMKWISWMKPDSVHPDFHIASAFGVLQLV